MGSIKTFNKLQLRDRDQLLFAKNLAEDIIMDISQTIRDYKFQDSSSSASLTYSKVSKVVLERYKNLIKNEPRLDRTTATALSFLRRIDRPTHFDLSILHKKSYLSTIKFKDKYAFAKSAFSTQRIKDAFEGMASQEWLEQAAPDTYLKLNLHLKEVYCQDETGSGFFGEAGKDEINFGGVAINELGEQHEINEFHVKDFSDKDDASDRIKTYSGLGKVLHTFMLNEHAENECKFPYIYHSYIAISEKDCGGFSEFLEKLWEAVEPIVLEAMAAIGVSIGATIGSAGGPLGTVIGAILGAVVGAIVGFLIKAFKDDVFEPQIIATSLPSFTENFNGAEHTPLETFYFDQHDGSYRLKLCWSLEK